MPHDTDEVQAAMQRARAAYDVHRKRLRHPLLPENVPAAVDYIDAHHAVVYHAEGRANENRVFAIRRLERRGFRVVKSIQELLDSRAKLASPSLKTFRDSSRLH